MHFRWKHKTSDMHSCIKAPSSSSKPVHGLSLVQASRGQVKYSLKFAYRELKLAGISGS